METYKVLRESEGSASSSQIMFDSKIGFIEAVKMTGRNKGTLSKDTKAGKLPFEISESGQKLYKVSDLYSLYGFINPEETKFSDLKKLTETKKETNGNNVELAILKERLRSQETMLTMKDAQIRDLQSSRDKLLEQNNRLTLLLPAPVSPVKPIETLLEEQKKPWWKRFF